jgi:hypothetical protein
MTHDATLLARSVLSSTTTSEGQSANGLIRGRDAAEAAPPHPLPPPRKSGEGMAPSPYGKVFPREPHEHYVEAEWCSRRLFAEVSFGDRGSALILDPAAGFGHVPRAARGAGYRAIGTDIVKRARDVRGGRDFLSPHYKRPGACETARPRDGPGPSPLPLPARAGRGGTRARLSIVCNPPFDEIRAFIEKALRLADHRVAMLFPQHRFNAAGWLEELPLIRTLYLSPRPSMWPGPLHKAKLAAGEKLGCGRQDFCWLIFEVGGRFRGRVGWLRRDG